MKKSAVLVFMLLLIMMGICASADTTVNQSFSDFEAVSDVVPGRLFSMYTNKAPELEVHNNFRCLKIDSDDNADNILLMNPQSFKEGGFSVKFQITADSAPKVNWGKAPHIIVRYKNQNGSWVNDTIAEFAYDLIRVRIDGTEIKASGFFANSFYDFEFDFVREENTFKLVYKIGVNEYTKEYATCNDGDICVGFFSYLGNALYIRNIDFSESYSKGLTDEEIKTAFNEQNPSRPRILMDSDRLNEIRGLINTDEHFREWYVNVKQMADTALTTPVSQYELRDGERLLYVSRDVYNNTVYPAFVYLIEGGENYINRVWAELSAAAGFEDWHPMHFLDTAEMTFAFAICYDWLYDYWDEEQLQVIRTAIKELGLDAAMEAYDGSAEYDSSVYGAYHNRIGWKNDASNWGLVCNGGIAVGAMAIMNNENADYCADILEDAMRGIELPMSVYADDGAWLEGVGYWHYATQYLSYMMSSMENTLGSTYEYMESDGVKAAAQYLVAHTGPAGTFNYGDCTETIVSAPELFYLSDFYEDSSIYSARLGMMERFGIDGGIDDILFCNPYIKNNEDSSLRYARFDSVGVVTATNSITSDMANYIAMKAGKVGVTHGDLDAGTFVIDALGERWVTDYGSDSYTLPGYFDWATRINYYRKRAEGHSTLVINPDSGADQRIGATAPITDFVSGENGMLAITDMSEVYSDDADSVKRAVSLFDNNSRFMVQDEITSQTPADVYWFLQTDKTVNIALDKKSITLSSGNKRLLMLLQSNSGTASFSVTAAKPLASSPKPTGQAANNEYMRICIVNEDVTDLCLRVTFIPYIAGSEPDTTEIDELISIDKMLENADFNVEGITAELSINGQKTDKLSDGTAEINVKRNNSVSDVFIACYDVTGQIKSVRCFDSSEDILPTYFEVKETDTIKVFAWKEQIQPVSSVISFGTEL